MTDQVRSSPIADLAKVIRLGIRPTHRLASSFNKHTGKPDLYG
jgi:hypothetical protein